MKTQVACFGEVLWDLLPSGKVAGGAPMNVACQLNNLGHRVAMVSSVGMDDLGNNILRFLDARGVDVSTIQIDAEYPTGVVNVSLTAAGQPSYEIVQPSAWDYIGLNDQLEKLAKEVKILVYGSLACRNAHSKQTLLSLLPQVKTAVFDVNLRSPFYSPELIDELAAEADILKLNDAELVLLSEWYGLAGSDMDQMEGLVKRFSLKGIMQTRGDKGAIYFDGQQFSEHMGFKVTVQDTVGSGDAFLAGFLHGLLEGNAAPQNLAFGCGMGALTATHKGGTPVISLGDLQAFIQK